MREFGQATLVATDRVKHILIALWVIISNCLLQGEIKLPTIMEDEHHKEIPSIHHFYRPIRQMVYAILFNLHHHTYMATKSKESKAGQLSTV